jgi:dolichol-phosphate mannosyltransferase
VARSPRSDSTDPLVEETPVRATGREVFVVLPAYNEAANLGSLLRRIDEALHEAGISFTVIVVNDGSTDATGSVAREHGASMRLVSIDHDTNLGLGPTIRDGLFEAAGRSGPRDIVVTMDADETHTPGLILRMVRMISEGFDVVIASRYRAGSRMVGVPLGRRVLSRGASWLFRIVFPTRGVRDFTSGFRAYRASVLKKGIEEYGSRFVDQDGFQSIVDILLKIRRMPVVIGEVPFVLRYDFKEGGTKMKVGSTMLRTLRLMVERRFRR